MRVLHRNSKENEVILVLKWQGSSIFKMGGGVHRITMKSHWLSQQQTVLRISLTITVLIITFCFEKFCKQEVLEKSQVYSLLEPKPNYSTKISLTRPNYLT